MSLFSAIFVYLITWWTVLFAVLPYGNRGNVANETGMAPGAPTHPHLKTKFVATTIVAAVVWLGIYLFIEADIISFHDIAEQMTIEDKTR